MWQAEITQRHTRGHILDITVIIDIQVTRYPILMEAVIYFLNLISYKKMF